MPSRFCLSILLSSSGTKHFLPKVLSEVDAAAWGDSLGFILFMVFGMLSELSTNHTMQRWDTVIWLISYPSQNGMV